jgi:poly(A) polymerase Pap1
MYETLKNRSEVSEITVVAEAFVPIIKLVFSDFHVSWGSKSSESNLLD